MKKIIVTMLALGGTLVLAGAANAVITGSAHDLSARVTANNPESQLCIYCHTPHHADTSVNDAPLWNHDVTATAAYTLYSSATLDASPGQPNGVSRLCLSCHDGTVALDAFGGMAGNLGTIGAAGDLGTDLSNDHPVSFVYDSTLASDDGELFNPDTTVIPGGAAGETITTEWLFTGNAFECASCHDVHNQAGIASMLHVDNTGSDLCLTCHNK